MRAAPHPSLMSFGAVQVISPDGSNRLPVELAADFAMITLLEPEPEEHADWIRRLELQLGVSDYHRRALARATVLAFPGEEAQPTGHALTKLMDEPEGQLQKQVRRESQVRPFDEHLEWYLVRAATRREARAEEALVEAGFAVYLPRMTRWRRTGREKERVEHSLFGGYLFVGLLPGQSLMRVEAIDAVHGVVRFGRAEEPSPLAFKEIRQVLDDELAGEHDKTRRRTEVEPGSPVTILHGQFKAFPAEFVKMRENERVEVMLQMFGRKTPMVLDRDDVALSGQDD